MLLALAAKDLAGSLPRIGTLVLAPDTLTSLIARLTANANGLPGGDGDGSNPGVTAAGGAAR
jgi:hypothetical protein